VIQTGGARIRSTRNKSNENYPKPNQIMHPLLLSALIQVESGGNDHAKGRHGELGALQIKPILVRDVNRIMGTHYTHAQVTNRATATFIANAYLNHYGRNLSDESLARLWQGGPKGLRRSSTRAYGKRVMRELERRTQVATSNKLQTFPTK
jgi:soluble lytic murein transglycosylase-like protein